MESLGSEPIRVIIVDDHAPTRWGIKALLALEPGIEVVGEADDGCEALPLVAQVRPDVVLMDGKMPIMDGIEATQLIKSQWPEIKVIVLTMSRRYSARAINAGADASLLKDESSVYTLPDIIREI